MDEKLPDNTSQGLSSQFSKELLNPSIDLTIDYTEIYIDDFMENGILRDIPIVKSVVGIIKVGISINQLWFAKKLLTFIKEFNTGSINPEKKEKFKQKLNEDEQYRKKVSEQIMVFLDRFISIDKAKISAKLFMAYVEEKINYEQFISINISLDKLHPDSYKFIISLEQINYKIDHAYKGERNWEAEALILTSGLAIEPGDFWSGFKLTEEGRLLYELAIKPILSRK